MNSGEVLVNPYSSIFKKYGLWGWTSQKVVDGDLLRCDAV
jgi:hypothetical protein